MVMIANLQYGWTLFVQPDRRQHHWARAAIQVAFTIFVAHRDLAGADRRLVRRPLRPAADRGRGRLLVGVAWVDQLLCATRSPLLYLGAALGGLGAGCVYGTCVGNALKWFPDRRGLAAGLTAAGFGAGSALTVIPIQRDHPASGYEAAFLWFGMARASSSSCWRCCCARRPGEARRHRRRRPQARARASRPAEMLRSPVFWLIYVDVRRWSPPAA